MEQTIFFVKSSMCQRDMLYQHVMHIQNSYTKNIFWVKSFDNLSINESLCNQSDQFPADFKLADDTIESFSVFRIHCVRLSIVLENQIYGRFMQSWCTTFN